MNIENIGNKIKLLRKSENMTQKDFSKRLLISQSYLSGVENGNEIPTDKLLKLICLEFGVNRKWLSDDKEDMYDSVYENDKSALLNVSNEALLNIMTMLSTKSNVEYGFYAYTLNTLTQILNYGNSFDDENKLLYLESAQNFMMDFKRTLEATLDKNEIAINNNKKEVINDMNDFISLVHNGL